MKAPCLFENTIDEFLRDAVALQVEKADRPADVSQLAGDRLAPSLPAAQVWRDVERGDFFVRARMVHQVDELVIIPDVTAHIMGIRIMRFQLFHRSCSFMFAPWGAKEPVSQEAGSAMSVTLTWTANLCKWAYVILSATMRWT